MSYIKPLKVWNLNFSFSKLKMCSFKNILHFCIGYIFLFILRRWIKCIAKFHSRHAQFWSWMWPTTQDEMTWYSSSVTRRTMTASIVLGSTLLIYLTLPHCQDSCNLGEVSWTIWLTCCVPATIFFCFFCDVIIQFELAEHVIKLDYIACSSALLLNHT